MLLSGGLIQTGVLRSISIRSAVVRKNSIRRLSSAITSARSRCTLLEAVLVVEATEDRSRHNPRGTGELVARNQDRWQPRRWLRKARAEARVWAPAVVVHFPRMKDSAQVLFAEWD